MTTKLTSCVMQLSKRGRRETAVLYSRLFVFAFFFCPGLFCIATSAPTGYVGNCPAGTVCTNVTCADGFGLLEGWNTPMAYCPSTGSPFLFYGCGLCAYPTLLKAF